MKQMEHSYKGEEKFLVNDLKTIVSKARSKLSLPSIILW